MKLNRKLFTTTLSGEPTTLEISELALQANAAVIGRHGGTTVLVTVVMGKTDIAKDYFPLTVDYEERFYAAGKILGSRFVRREGRPSDDAVLSGRLIDRTIRPLFDSSLRREVQVTVTVLEYDGAHDPDAIALLTVSTALSISDIPWNGPVAGVPETLRAADGSLHHASFFAGPEDRINMIELEGIDISETEALELFVRAQKDIATLVSFQRDVVASIGKKKVVLAKTEQDAALETTVTAFIEPLAEDALYNKDVEALKEKLQAHLAEAGIVASEEAVLAAFERVVDSFVHRMAIERAMRVDGRAFDTVRDLYAEAGVLTRTHGSALFIRGTTQVLAVVTLAGPSAAQLVETMETTTERRFMLHYNFPNFSTGETGRSRGPGRREIGHGALAHKAVVNMLPSKDVFPYTIRVVAETLSSNGSSSMATTCATILALMDAGVPIKKPVAGIAMGLMSDASGKYKILTDIQGPEDHYGDMDLKIAGTTEGITAIQMDVKVQGITPEMFKEALSAAQKARQQILGVITGVLSAPREALSPYAPTIRIIKINPDKIGTVIGPGGKTINGIIEACGGAVTIDLDEDGSVFITGTEVTAVAQALKTVEDLTREYTVGDIVEGPVIKTLEFGAIVDLGGGRDGMIHVSELRDGFVKNVEEVVKVGDHVRAKIVRSDPDGRIGLSIKKLQQQ